MRERLPINALQYRPTIVRGDQKRIVDQTMPQRFDIDHPAEIEGGDHSVFREHGWRS
jgi:hypothetical protein